jgi:predicted DNA-binding protein
MEKPKLQIRPKRYTEESAIMSARLPKDMIRALDEVAVKTGRTRNEIVALSLEFALDNMEIAQEGQNENFDLPLK